MRLLLSTLTSLSVLGGAIAPALVKNTNTTPMRVTPQRRVQISLGGSRYISTFQDTRTLTFNFNLNLQGGERITAIEFDGTGLQSVAEWGSERWIDGWTELPVGPLVSGFTTYVFLDQEHWDGLAYQHTMGSYNLTSWIPGNYSLTFTYMTEADWSFTPSSGRLTIGSYLNLVIE